MEEINEVKDKIEYMYLRSIISGLRDGSLTVPQSRSLARALLSLQPFQTVEDARNKITVLVNQHPRFIDIKNYVDRYYEEKKTEAIIERMRQLIKGNNIEGALQVAQHG